MNIQDIYVSACRGAFDRNVYDVRLIDWLENVRPQIPLNDYAKKQLPAIMPHGLFGTRRQDTFKQHSGLVQIDIDGKHQGKDFDCDALLRQMEGDRTVLAFGMSCGGNGVYAFYHLEGITGPHHRQYVEKLLEHVRDYHEVVPDEAVSYNLSSLRFASPYMPHINYDAASLQLFP